MSQVFTGFKVRVGVVVVDGQNRLLLARQNNKPFWVLPGGTLEARESMGACAIRELKEEANLDIIEVRLLYLADFIRDDGSQVMDVVFTARLVGGSLIQETTQNINDLGFFTWQEVSQMPVKPELVFRHLMPLWQAGSLQQGDAQGQYLGVYEA